MWYDLIVNVSRVYCQIGNCYVFPESCKMHGYNFAIREAKICLGPQSCNFFLGITLCNLALFNHYYINKINESHTILFQYKYYLSRSRCSPKDK